MGNSSVFNSSIDSCTATCRKVQGSENVRRPPVMRPDVTATGACAANTLNTDAGVAEVEGQKRKSDLAKTRVEKMAESRPGISSP